MIVVDFAMNLLFLVVAAYLIGSLSFAVIVSRLMGLADPRTYGSNNPGATNVLRSGNKKAAALTLLGDAFKGWLAVATAQIAAPHLGLGDQAIAICAVAATLGHMWPVFFGFKGGKGVATALGAFLYLAPLAVLGCVAVFAFSVALSGFVSLGSLLASMSMLVWLLVLQVPTWKLGLAGFIVAMIWIKHRENIGRLLSGTEKSWQKKAEA